MADKDDTFRILKHGEDYESTLLDKWLSSEDVEIREKDKDYILEQLQRDAGIVPPTGV